MTVEKYLKEIKGPATPAGSGMRNTHLKQIVHAPNGKKTLAAWCAIWGSGRVPNIMAVIFLNFVLFTLSKGEKGA